MKIRTIAASLLVFLHGGCLFAGAAEAGGGTVLVPAPASAALEPSGK